MCVHRVWCSRVSNSRRHSGALFPPKGVRTLSTASFSGELDASCFCGMTCSKGMRHVRAPADLHAALLPVPTLQLH